LLKELIRDGRGFATVLAMFILPLMVILMVSSVEVSRDKHGADVDLQGAVEQAAYAAANGVDNTSQANGTPYIDPAKAHAYFKTYLAKNLMLDPVTLAPGEKSGLKSTPEYQLLVVNGDNPYTEKGYVYGGSSEGVVDVSIPVTLGISADGIDLSGAGERQTTIKLPSCVVFVKAELGEVVAKNAERETVRWAVGRLIRR